MLADFLNDHFLFFKKVEKVAKKKYMVGKNQSIALANGIFFEKTKYPLSVYFCDLNKKCGFRRWMILFWVEFWPTPLFVRPLFVRHFDLAESFMMKMDLYTLCH